MNIVIYCGCQTIPLHYYLKKYNKDHNKNMKITYIYNIISYVYRSDENHETVNDYGIVDDYGAGKYNTILKKSYDEVSQLLNEANVFIYQYAPDTLGVYSSSYLLTKLNKKCKKIYFPLTCNTGFFPLIPYTDSDNLIYGIYHLNQYVLSEKDFSDYLNKQRPDNIENNPKKCHNDEIILNLKKQGLSLEKILYMYDNNQIDFKFEERFQKCINIQREKEKSCDIKVCDFIMEHKSKRRLFVQYYHPCACILIHKTNQVFKLLNIDFYINPLSVPDQIPGLELYSVPSCRNDFNSTDGDVFYKKHIKHIYNNTLCQEKGLILELKAQSSLVKFGNSCLSNKITQNLNIVKKF